MKPEIPVTFLPIAKRIARERIAAHEKRGSHRVSRINNDEFVDTQGLLGELAFQCYTGVHGNYWRQNAQADDGDFETPTGWLDVKTVQWGHRYLVIPMDYGLKSPKVRWLVAAR